MIGLIKTARIIIFDQSSLPIGTGLSGFSTREKAT